MENAMKPETRTVTIPAKLTRTIELREPQVDQEARTVSLSFSSELPVERFWGNEVLDHTPEAVNLSRLNSGGALLVNHDTRDQVGVVREAVLDAKEKVCRAVVKFGRSARAKEILDDVVDGVRRLVSVGYSIDQLRLESEADGVETYRVTRWTPLEVSLVPIPADPSVGVGRSIEMPDPETRTLTVEVPSKRSQPEQPKMSEPVTQPKNELEIERNRIKEIRAIGKQNAQLADMAEQAIDAGTSLDEFRANALARLNNAKPVPSFTSPEIGLSEKEAKRYSFVRLINALANPSDHRAQQEAAFEFECSRAAEKVTRRSPQGAFVPWDVQTRDLTKGSATAGGNLIATNLLGGSFIELLRNRIMCQKMGATMLNGLVGDVAIPTQSAGATAYWVAENAAPTEGAQTFGQVTLSPKTVGAFTDIGRRLIIQSSVDIENMDQQDLAKQLAIAIDLAALHGTAQNNQPRGIVNVSGIGSVAGGDNGLAPAWSHLVSLESEVAVDNADVGSLGYLTNPKVRGKLKSTFRNATYGEVPLWTDSAEVGMGMLNGYKAGATNQVSAALTKGSANGTASAIFYGNWSDLIIASWGGGLDVLVDPYTGSAAGTVRVRVLADVDVAVRHAESFAAMLDALPA
jgi:HK97 family phage major capsid protein